MFSSLLSTICFFAYDFVAQVSYHLSKLLLSERRMIEHLLSSLIFHKY